MAYPSIQQYQEALQHPQTAFVDPSLASGRIRTSGMGTPIVVSGGFALTYAVEAGGKKFAVRCFHREAKGLERRYSAISSKLKALRSPYFLDFEYQTQGVRVSGAQFPVVKMAWGSGDTLGVFVEDNFNDRAKLTNLIKSLEQLNVHLEQNGIAHGDIQEGNLMVADAGRTIKLIDYDGMFVPEIATLGGSENGHRDYQHPKRDHTNYDSRLDRFSFISLNLALRALCEKPTLWDLSQSGAGVILFRANDFAAPGSSAVLSAIHAVALLQQEASNFAAICTAGYADVPTLHDFVAGRNIPKAALQLQNSPRVQTKPVGYISQYPVLDAANFEAFLSNEGQMVELVGCIFSVRLDKTRYGKPYAFINFSHWQGKSVKITLWSEGLEKGGEQPSANWVGRWVTIKGLVEPVFRRSRYEHISITAAALSQITQLTEQEAKHRLARPASRNLPSAPVSHNNSDALLRLRQGTSAAQSTPVPATQPAKSSSNQALLKAMQTQRPPVSVTGRSRPVSPPTPSQQTPSSAPHWPGATPPKPTGFFGWLASLFK